MVDNNTNINNPVEIKEDPVPVETTHLHWKGFGHALRFTLFMGCSLVALAAIVQFVALPAITLAVALSAASSPFVFALCAFSAALAIYLSLLALVTAIIKIAERCGVHDAGALVNEQAKYHLEYISRH